MRNRISLSSFFLILCLSLSACAPSSPVTTAAAPQEWIFVGTYTQTGDQQRAEGIFTYRFDPIRGELTLLNKTRSLPNPSYLTVDPSRRYLLAVSEVGEYNGQPGGWVSSYAIAPESGALTLINSQPTGGANPCYVSVDASGRWVLVANYSGGSLTVLPLGADGSLGQRTDLVQHSGHGVNPDRQEAAHAHSILVSPTDPGLIVSADLGMDRIFVYDLDSHSGKLRPHSPTAEIITAAGAGPRHLTFSADGRLLYVLNELNATLNVYDAASSTFDLLQTVSLLPDSFGGKNLAADLHLLPSGKALIASNRGADTLAGFAVDGQTGKLTPTTQTPTQGKTPRNFAIAPEGNFLIVANQESGTLVTFSVDVTTGSLKATGSVIKVDAPVCVQFYKGK